MREFNLDLLIGKDVVVNCKTKDEQHEFLNFLDSKGIEWNSGYSIFKSGIYDYSEFKETTCFLLKTGMLQYSPISWFQEEGYKILSLDDLVIKPKNNFKEYGFEADFDGEILAVKDDKYFGISKSTESEGWVANGWKKDGTCLYDYVSHLNPIKKEWYEKEDNFRIAVKQTKSINDFDDIDDYVYIMEKITDRKGVSIYVTNGYHTPLQWLKCYRPATKEEVLSLMTKI